MWAMVLLCSGLIGALLTTPQQQTQVKPAVADPYSVDFVSSAFYFFRDSRGGFEGEAKRFFVPTPSLPELGDRASIAMLKILKPSELVERQNAYAYLGVVSLAFAYPKRLSREADLEPKVTMFVLDYLKERETTDLQLEDRIALIADCVQNRTCKSAIENASRKSR
jgi:hypothetical protein